MKILTSRAGSAGGPKPGRAGFYLELGRAYLKRVSAVFRTSSEPGTAMTTRTEPA